MFILAMNDADAAALLREARDLRIDADELLQKLNGTDVTELPPLAEDEIPDYGVPAREALRRQAESDPAERTTSLIDWDSEAAQHPRELDWVIREWLPYGDPTLLAGSGGSGKSYVAQTIGTAIAMGVNYLEPIRRPRSVLMWACEDSEDEVCRRQLAICSSLGVSMHGLTDHLMVDVRRGLDSTLMAREVGMLRAQGAFAVLREQVNDLGIDVLILDNLAHCYGGDESNRHEVTQLISSVQGLRAGLTTLFLGHTSRQQGSEFSGSSAWENAVRMRWYLGFQLPDQPPDDELREHVSNERFLCRRKNNYTSQDWRKLVLTNGVFMPETPEEIINTASGVYRQLRENRAMRRLMDGVRQLITRGIYGSERRGANYLPRMIVQYGLHAGANQAELERAMRAAIVEGTLIKQQVGVYGNRTPRYGLVLPPPPDPDAGL